MTKRWKPWAQLAYPLSKGDMIKLQFDVDRAYARANAKRYLPIPTNENSRILAAEYQTWVQNGREC